MECWTPTNHQLWGGRYIYLGYSFLLVLNVLKMILLPEASCQVKLLLILLILFKFANRFFFYRLFYLKKESICWTDKSNWINYADAFTDLFIVHNWLPNVVVSCAIRLKEIRNRIVSKPLFSLCYFFKIRKIVLPIRITWILSVNLFSQIMNTYSRYNVM